MKQIWITEEQKDSIIQIDDAYMTVIIFGKKYYSKVKKLKTLTKTGIYILNGKEKSYIGQSSNQKGIITRLQRHYTNKLWWDNAIVIIPKYIMTKSHYDYIEKSLITHMMRFGNELDNKTDGNVSPITNDDRNNADLFLAHVLNTLSQIFNINMYHINQKRYIHHLENTIQKLIAGTLEDNE